MIDVHLEYFNLIIKSYQLASKFFPKNILQTVHKLKRITLITFLITQQI